MSDIPQWRLKGDWFDVCKCNIPCPCYFAQAPTFGDCDGILAWHITEGKYGDVVLDGLNVIALGAFTGNIWSGKATNSDMGIFFDDKADDRQREGLQKIFGGEAGGWPAGFADLVDNLRGVEFVPIEFEVSPDLRWWSARVPGRVEARGEALQGPTSMGELVQVHNPAGAEVGPGTVATQGVAVVDRADGFEFRWERSGQSSKHMPFDWSGPDQA